MVEKDIKAEDKLEVVLIPYRQKPEEYSATLPRDSKTAQILPYQTQNLVDLYTLGHKVRHGHFGTIYLSTEKSIGKSYSYKSIPKRKLLYTEDYKDVLRKIQVMKHLSEQPHVVKIRGSYEDDVHVHLVMELCEGGELLDRIVRRGHYSEREVSKLMKTIVGVVVACHSLGVMYRDLKPNNFLSDNNKEDVAHKAVDFGLFLFYKSGQIFFDVVGSPYYVAPEVLCKHYGPEADVWSAGVILYILLRGMPLFWADLIRKMLDRDPKKRLTTRDLLYDIAPDKPLHCAVLSRLKKFFAMNKIKKMALHFIAERLAEEEIGALKEWFKMMDTDNNGTITFEELKNSLKEVKHELMDIEIKDLMDAADVDNSETMDYGECLATTLHLNKLEREENLVLAFSVFDKDDSGYITKYLDEMIKEIDQDDDRQIDYGGVCSNDEEGQWRNEEENNE
ncbi:hypothetical protein I3842_15G168800 [Carya illinoinensis]|uniref:Calcium-dependent protein kinase n=1 Tax=Carya illinoinensis TaxID=32201 RepID=A0A922AD84_CARIL|nr:hypothetical protein I3842_15G168800 [Carya illinoinensis]